MNLIKLARRNMWRNKRRTIITSASIFVAVFIALLMRSFQLGAYGSMVSETIGKISGYLQVQNVDYFYEPNLDNSMEYSSALINTIQNSEGVSAAVPRIEAGGLASFGNKSKSVVITGIDPEAESAMSNPEKMLVNYRLSEKAIEALANEIPFTDKQSERAMLLKGSVYNKLDFIAVDLSFDGVEFDKYRSLFEKYCRVESKYLTPDDDGVLLADNLAIFLDIEIGDTLVLLGQGYHGVSAADLFPVRGFVKSPSPQLNNKLIYMTNSAAQSFFGMEGRVTYIAVNLNEKDDMLEIQSGIAAMLVGDDTYTVKNWQELNPSIYTAIKGDDQGGQVVLFILYFVIFFGILGTVMMMVGERKREFGILNAIGMKKSKLKKSIIYEMIVIGILGVIAGIALSLPIILYFSANPIELTGVAGKTFQELGFAPILPAQGVGSYFFNQIMVVLVMVLVACYIPLRKIRKMKIVDSLH